MTLHVCWKPSGVMEEIPIMGIDFDPSGTFWYYTSDPNDRTEVRSGSYHWARVL